MNPRKMILVYLAPSSKLVPPIDIFFGLKTSDRETKNSRACLHAKN